MPKDLILLAGATGFLGGTVAADLLQQERWKNVILLVRAPNVESARERVVQSVSRFEIDPALLARIQQVSAGIVIDHDAPIDGAVALFCATFLRPEMLHIHRQISGLKNFSPVVITQKREGDWAAERLIWIKISCFTSVSFTTTGCRRFSKIYSLLPWPRR